MLSKISSSVFRRSYNISSKFVNNSCNNPRNLVGLFNSIKLFHINSFTRFAESTLTSNNSSSSSSSSRITGQVKWFDSGKGFGFITRDSGEDIFVHFTAIRGSGYRSLEEGQKVEFSIGQGSKGPAAQDVAVVAGMKKQ